MPLEIEIKFALSDPQAFLAFMQTQIGPPESSVLETNDFFDTPDGRLRRSDCGLRIRTECNSADGSFRRAVMTYKGPREPGPIKRREEIELTLTDPDSASAMIQRLGFVRLLSFQKRRRTWHIADCQVVLDELPHLGTFVEIEGPSNESILALRSQLGLDACEPIREGYASMVARLLAERPGETALNFPE